MLRLHDLPHAELAVLGREYLLAGQLIDRSGMPQLISRWGRDEMRDIAIAEWMGASPNYTRRMQRALRFEGDDVTTIFKGMQLDIGAPPEFMDFRYRVHGPDRGEFWLDHCGALMDVEPMGDDYVHAMCTDIEDPTFEATACASNPRARMVPIHRPPRQPADRHPHCHWEIVIDRDAELAEPAPALRVAGTRANAVAVDLFGADDDGMADYSGSLDSDLRLEDFSSRALSAITQEACLQGHLLVLSFLAEVERRHGTEAAVDVGEQQFTGVAGVVAGRLVDALGLGSSPDDIATVLELHPAFHPRSYVDWRVELDGDRVRVELGDCPALEETGIESWITLLGDGRARALDAIVAAVDPRARCVATTPGDRAAWDVVVGDEAATEPPEVTLTKFSTGAGFRFRRVGTRV